MELVKHRRRNLPDLTGLTFGRLTVIKFSGYDERGSRLWDCICQCKKPATVLGYNLKAGSTASCGCLRSVPRPHARLQRSLSHGISAKNQVISTYKWRAKRYSIDWFLTAEQIDLLLVGACHYCGRPPSNYCKPKRANGGYLHNGIDRLDSSKGYECGNVVSCCGTCNIAKNDTPYSDFIEWISKVYLNLHKNGSV